MPDTLAFVIPWYGQDLGGGAESECRGTALALRARGVPVEILATCARDHGSGWVDHHQAGASEEEGLTIRRFAVRPRNASRYNQLQERLRLGGALTGREEAEFVGNSIHSDELYAYLGREQARYWYAFIPYCFGTTWAGALVASERSVLIPCLHDEPFARLGPTRQLIRAVRGVLLHVPAERALAEAMAGGDPGNLFVVGEGVDTAVAGDAARFRRKYHVEAPFLLYAGRKTPDKNTPLLVEYFARYRLTRRERPLKLLLIGGGGVRIPERFGRDVIDLGFVPTQDKYDAYAAALALCQPSLLESFSIVMMEAWLCGTPTLVHAACPVTREHCLASNGGLYFEDAFEFAEVVERLVEDEPLRRRLADNGRAYVLAHFTWDRVTRHYLEVLHTLGARLS